MPSEASVRGPRETDVLTLKRERPRTGLELSVQCPYKSHNTQDHTVQKLSAAALCGELSRSVTRCDQQFGLGTNLADAQPGDERASVIDGRDWRVQCEVLCG